VNARNAGDAIHIVEYKSRGARTKGMVCMGSAWGMKDSLNREKGRKTVASARTDAKVEKLTHRVFII